MNKLLIYELFSISLVSAGNFGLLAYGLGMFFVLIFSLIILVAGKNILFKIGSMAFLVFSLYELYILLTYCI